MEKPDPEDIKAILGSRDRSPMPSQDITIRWMLPADMKAVLAIENESECHPPWDGTYFFQRIRDKDIVAIVATIGTDVAGFLVELLGTTTLYIVKLAVSRQHRRLGVGTALVEGLKPKVVGSSPRKSISVWGTNGTAHQFFKAVGFHAVDVGKALGHIHFMWGEDEWTVLFKKVEELEQMQNLRRHRHQDDFIQRLKET